MLSQSNVSLKNGGRKDLVASFYDIYLLGITIVVAGQLCIWNIGLQIGFWEYFIGLMIASAGHICLTLCLAEMSSFLTFAGGSYGFVRCSMGSTMGYLAGFFESVEYTLYHAIAVAQFADLFPAMTGMDKKYSPLIWLVFYAIALPISIRGGKFFYLFSNVIAVYLMLLIIVYCCGMLPEVNLPKYSTGFIGGGMEFMQNYSSTLWFYVGVEALTLASDEIKDAGKEVPKAITALVLTMFVTSILVFFFTSAVSPGPSGLVTEWSPLNPGLRSVFHLNDMALSYIAMPASFATGFGFMFAYGHQLHSMSKSGLFPKFLSGTYGDYVTPHRSLLAGSFFSFCLLLVTFHTVENYQKLIFNMCMLSSCWVYVTLGRAYIICHDRYSNLDRTFRSPVGKWGAYCTMVVYSLMIVGLAFFQDDNYVSFILFMICLVLGYLYYYFVGQGREFFSQEEQKRFMKAYILNANHRRKKSKSSKTFFFFAQVSRLFGGVRVRPMLTKSKAPNSVDIEKQSTPSEQDKSSVIMDPALPSPSARMNIGVRANVGTTTPVECDSPVQAVNAVTRQNEDEARELDSEIRNPSITR